MVFTLVIIWQVNDFVLHISRLIICWHTICSALYTSSHLATFTLNIWIKLLCLTTRCQIRQEDIMSLNFFLAYYSRVFFWHNFKWNTTLHMERYNYNCRRHVQIIPLVQKTHYGKNAIRIMRSNSTWLIWHNMNRNSNFWPLCWCIIHFYKHVVFQWQYGRFKDSYYLD